MITRNVRTSCGGGFLRNSGGGSTAWRIPNNNINSIIRINGVHQSTILHGYFSSISSSSGSDSITVRSFRYIDIYRKRYIYI